MSQQNDRADIISEICQQLGHQNATPMSVWKYKKSILIIIL
jgi:hypothetical protein